MKKITISIVFTLVLCFFAGQLHAQDGYTYTISHNGSLSFTVSAVPNASASNFPTSVQSYGFTITLPDGVTGSITSSFGSGAGATFFNGSDVGESSIDGYLITETLGSPMGLPAPSTGIVSPMVTFQVDGSPTSGEIRLLANNSSLAMAVTPLKCFMSADMTDDGIANFPPVVDSVGSGLSGTTSFMFDTLNIPTTELIGVSVYPNPTSDVIHIQSQNQIDKVELFDITGKRVYKQYKQNRLK